MYDQMDLAAAADGGQKKAGEEEGEEGGGGKGGGGGGGGGGVVTETENLSKGVQGGRSDCISARTTLLIRGVSCVSFAYVMCLMAHT